LPYKKLKRQRPNLKVRIVVTIDYYVPRDRVELYIDGARTYVAYLLVYSCVSRRDTIEVEDKVL
jgi:hypothetical protein